MAAYIIVEIEITDPVGYEEYQEPGRRDRGKIRRKIHRAWRRSRNIGRRLASEAIVVLQFENHGTRKEW